MPAAGKNDIKTRSQEAFPETYDTISFLYLNSSANLYDYVYYRGVLMRKLYIFFPKIFILGLLLGACAIPPTDEMNRAMDAVTRAENDADAIAYAPGVLVRARDALSRMQSEADAKNYNEAKNFAAEAVRSAERALMEGKAGSEKAREEAANLLNSLSVPLAETSQALNAANGIQNLQLDLDTLSMDMDLAQQTYKDASESFQADNYQDSIEGCKTVRNLLSGINGQLNETVQETMRKK
jgi:hypothetical protein